MSKIDFPAFEESKFQKNVENNACEATVISDAAAEDFSAYCRLLEKSGFEKKEGRDTACQHFAAYWDGESAIFLNYFPAVRELYLVTEDNGKYFSYSDTALDAEVEPQITQMHIEDFGMSYVIRLTDGRFILIDGGRDFDVDREKLYRHLLASSPYEKPVIAAWFLTHAHPDHFHLFAGFAQSHGDKVKVEKVFFNFPERDDGRFSVLAHADPRFDYDNSGFVWIPKMLAAVEKLGAQVYTPHTGQTYRIGGAACEILATMDDTLHASRDMNATSVVMRMELAGQTVLWSADGAYSAAKLPEKYGEYLKSDILQVPHHGFQSGDWEAEIAGFKLILPEICFLPVSDFNAYTAFSAHKNGARYLMTQADVGEMITDGTRTVTLPYTPSAGAKAELARKYRVGQGACGARTWIFTDLNTSNPEDFEFTFFNATHVRPIVWIELLFEDTSKKIRGIKAELPSTAIKTLSIVGDKVDADAHYFDYLSLKKQGIPENAPFAVRFMSDVPIVVSHKTHKAAHVSD